VFVVAPKVDPGAASDYSGGEDQPHKAHPVHVLSRVDFRLDMRARLPGGLMINRRRAIRALGMVVAALTVLALISSLFSAPEPAPLPDDVGLTGLDSSQPTPLEPDIASTARARPDSPPHPKKAKSGRNRRTPPDRSPERNSPVPVPAYLPPPVSAQAPVRSGGGNQFGFER